MSYDISLLPAEPDAEWNYTSNCVPMWCAAGADLASFHGQLAGDCAHVVLSAVATLIEDRERFMAMNPTNGFGSYESLWPALFALARLFYRYPGHTVQVSH